MIYIIIYTQPKVERLKMKIIIGIASQLLFNIAYILLISCSVSSYAKVSFSVLYLKNGKIHVKKVQTLLGNVCR